MARLREFNLRDGVIFPFFFRGPWPTFTAAGDRLLPGEHLPDLTPEETLILAPQYGTPPAVAPTVPTPAAALQIAVLSTPSPPPAMTGAELLAMLQAVPDATPAAPAPPPPPPRRHRSFRSACRRRIYSLAPSSPST